MPATRVLIVDDSSLIRNVVRLLLAKEPAIESIVEAASAVEAWHVLNRGMIDVVTLDLNLPDGDGLQIIQSLKSRAGPGVVVVSGNVETHSMALQMGAAACFEKSSLIRKCTLFIDSILRAHETSSRPH